MASEAIVSGVVGDMVGRAMSLLAGQLGRDQQRGRGAEAKLRRLRRLLVRVESAVDAAGARRITSRALLAWLADLAGAAHRGRYLLDAASRGDDEDGGSGGHTDDAGNKQVMARSFSLPSSFNAAKRLRVAAGRLLSGAGHELDTVLADLEGLAGDITEFVLLLQCCPPALHRPLRGATGIYADSHMFGRHAERRRVLEFLLHGDDEDGDRCCSPELGVLPVVGRAGLEKTTLVQHACEEPAVRARFSLVMVLDFHCMSLMPAPGETALFLRSLFAAASGTPNPNAINNVSDEQQLRLQLLEHKLRGERFLAVFDNVDAHRRHVLDAVLPALRRGGRRGSKVIVTSSDASHVSGLGTAEQIVLRPLPPEEYWFFFKAHAFKAGDVDVDPRMAAAGQAIAEKLRLRGSFFGGKIVGAILRTRPDTRVWRRLLSSIADLPCLGNGGYIAAAAGNLLPPHVTVQGVSVSGSPLRGLVGLQDASLSSSPPPPTDDGGRRRPELPVLLCKSVFPSYCLYYTAHCTIDTEINQ